MNFDDFYSEIKLSYKQHPHDQREEELYSIVLNILRDTNDNKRKYSFRDIHQNPKKRNNVLYGISSNPDLAIYDLKLTDDTDYNQKKFIHGVVEIKAIGTKLENKEKTQLLNEVVWFGRVLYTNGVHWVLYEYDNTKIGKELEDIYRLNERLVLTIYERKNEENKINEETEIIKKLKGEEIAITQEIDKTLKPITSNLVLDNLINKDFDIWLCNKKTIFSKKDIPILPQRFPRLSEKKYNELCQKLRDLNWKSKV